MVVQATLLSTLKPPVGEAGTGQPNPAASAGASAAVQGPSPRPAQKAPDAADIQKTLSDARGVAEAAGASLEFTIDKDSGKTVVKVVDSATSQVIRQIPSEELLSLARHMTKLEGMLLNQKA
ncbi:MAG: flagellar protein [Betaproteobacteria bacterium]|nr:flagellar protein [Betaproteobacteria bacterium]